MSDPIEVYGPRNRRTDPPIYDQRPAATQTVKEYAHANGLTDRTVWNWIRKGALETVKYGGARLVVIDRRPSHGS